ncbi:hypothetical protein [Gloeothece verrucosa]|uniref:Uncharacterized protein n=1 Tax=Gloeothece verrucosa (strain PCC 7822) TaxID=497965 RepID=E0UE71_GLOV7|nr:hypothetical protein [Gloeothece verrucosa]ADN14196.1 hypothetical protein Cyan7822_2217 [Gloeothece verrucosa PCC 7822]
MKRLTNWLKLPKNRVLTGVRNSIRTGFIVGLFWVVGMIFTDDALAQTVITQTPKLDSTLQTIVTKTQFSLQKAVQDTNQVISDLPEQFDLAATETQPAIRKQIEDDIENRQDALENLADKVDDLAEKVKKYSKKLYGAGLGSQIQQNAQNLLLSLDNLANSINRLADDVEAARDNIIVPIGDQLRPQIEAVKGALQEAQQSIEAIQNPA